MHSTAAAQALADNPLVTRHDLQSALTTLLDPLLPHALGQGSGFHAGNTGVRYSPRVAAMEGWSRALWGIAPLVAGGGTWQGTDLHLEGLRHGIDPAQPWFWGQPTWADQIHVEMASLSLALLVAPKHYWQPLSETDKNRLVYWLGGIQKVELPANNWHFFRILVCLALRSLGQPVDTAAEDASFAVIESCWQGDGWYVDGVDINYDWYNPFGFHYYGLVYAAYAAKSTDPRIRQRGQVFHDRARQFIPQFLPWIREDGSVIPYGRSLSYRFGVIGFFSALAFAGTEGTADKTLEAIQAGQAGAAGLTWGQIKGLVLRHLRWWFRQPILDNGGILSIGYGYPNLIMAEQYNSPSSPYWALKAFLVLALDSTHPFWQAREEALPPQAECTSLTVPGYLISRSDQDAVLLCPGRYPGKEMVQGAAKYSKFAYSARFGFSVSHGAFGLEKTGCDSMLVLSEGDGYWRERRHARNQHCGTFWTRGTWNPWPQVEIRTTLIALGSWHVRIHLIHSDRVLEALEGGFSLPHFNGLEPCPWPQTTTIQAKDTPTDTDAAPQGASCTVSQPWAASRIANLPMPRNKDIPQPLRHPGSLTLEPNLNILHPVVMVPTLGCTIPQGTSILACAVRAGDATTDDIPLREAPLPPLVWHMDTTHDMQEGRPQSTGGKIRLGLQQALPVGGYRIEWLEL